MADPHIPATLSHAVEDMRKETDRGVAVVGASVLSDMLAVEIIGKLRPLETPDDLRIAEELFEHDGPLSTFSARRNLAYMLKIIDADSQKDLVTIGKIRNRFGHRIINSQDDDTLLTFETQRIKDACFSLRAVHKFAHFDLPELGIPATRSEDTARTRFIRSVLVIGIRMFLDNFEKSRIYHRGFVQRE